MCDGLSSFLVPKIKKTELYWDLVHRTLAAREAWDVECMGQ